MKVSTPLCLLAALSITFFSTHVLAQEVITGWVTNASTGEPIGFASILHKGSNRGAISDDEGFFQISALPELDSLTFSALGFKSLTLPVEALAATSRVSLQAHAFLLSEVVVRPLTPEEQLRKCIRRMDQNYASEAFTGDSYYRESMKENGNWLRHEEGGFRSWISPETTRRDHQLFLYRNADTQELQFMRQRAEKQKKKYLKKHPEEADSFEEGEVLLVDFGGPDEILDIDVRDGDMTFLDSSRHRGYRFSYGPESAYMGRELISIDYESRGKEDHKRVAGTIFIDKASDAIVSINERGKIVIPAAIKPILLMLGLGIKNPTYSLDITYRTIDDVWYPEKVRWDLDLHMTEHRLFRENRTARFEIGQIIAFRSYETVSPEPIPVHRRFDPEKKMEEQLHPIEGLSWKDIQ